MEFLLVIRDGEWKPCAYFIAGMPITQWNMPFKHAVLRIAFLRAAHAMETGITAFQDG